MNLSSDQSGSHEDSDDAAECPPEVHYDEALRQGIPNPDCAELPEGFQETIRMMDRLLRGNGTGDNPLSQRLLSDTQPNDAQSTEDADEKTVSQARKTLPSRFSVIRVVGRGAFGSVLLADDNLLRRKVAVKVPHHNVLMSPDLRERFQREWRAVARLYHPNLVRVLDVGVQGNHLWQVSEYVEGETLKTLLNQADFRPSWRQIARLIRDLADGVHHAHEQDVLHRDIKPENILIETPDQSPAAKSEPVLRPRLTDFGLARLLDEDLQLSRSGELIGTPKYMAPEQMQGKTSRIDARTDVFALGLVLYELLSGSVPYPEAVNLPARVVVFEKPVSRITATRNTDGRQSLPRDLETICLKCLRAASQDRYESAAALRDDLQRFLEGRPTLARPVPWHEHLWNWMRRHPSLASALGVCLLLIVGFVTFGIWHVRQLGRLNAELLEISEDRASQAAAAEQNRRTAEESAWLSARREFSAEMQQATSDWESGRFREMNEALLRFHPRSSGSLAAESAKRFEWRYLWRQGAKLRTWHVHQATVDCVTAAPNGQSVLTIGKDQRIVRWNPSADLPERVWHIDYYGDELRASISRDHSTGIVLQRHRQAAGNDASGENRDRVLVADLTTGRTLFRTEYEPRSVDDVALSDDGRIAIVTGAREWQSKPEPFVDLIDPRAGTIVSTASQFQTIEADAVSYPINTISAASFVPGGTDFLLTPIIFADAEPHFIRMRVSVDCSHARDPEKQEWQIADSRLLQPLTPGIPDHIRLSRDGGKCLITFRNESSVVALWDLNTDQLVTSPMFPDAVIESIPAAGFDHDGSLIMMSVIVSGQATSGESDQSHASPAERSRNEIHLWDPERRTLKLMDYNSAQDVIQIECLQSDGKNSWLMSESGGAIFRWDPAETGSSLSVNAHPTKEVWAVKYAPDGSSFYTAGDDHCVRRWRTSDLQLLAEYTHRDSLVSCLDVSPDGRYVAAGGYDDLVLIHDADSLELLVTLSDHTHDLRSVAFSADGKMLASGGRDRIVRIRNVAEFQPLYTLSDATDTIRSLVWTRQGTLLAADSSGWVRMYDSGHQPPRSVKFAQGINAMALLPTTIQFPMQSTPQTSPVESPGDSVKLPNPVLTISADEILALADTRGTVTLWHLPTSQKLLDFEIRGVELMSIAFSADGQSVAVGGRDQYVSIRDVVTGRNTLKLECSAFPVHAMAFSPNGQCITAALHDGHVLMFRTDN